MNRYLLNISYIGTRFRGVQKNIGLLKEDQIDRSTIQGLIEHRLLQLKPVNEIKLILSSRTDAGVHALQSSVHVDLERANGQPYDPDVITYLMNRNFYHQNNHIRVLNTILVPDTFHCRYNAKGRSYVYRIAVAKDRIIPAESPIKAHYFNYIPIEEIDRCYFIQNPNFDIETVKKAVSLFQGRHDFRTFMAVSKGSREQLKPTFTLRRIDEIRIVPGQPIVTQFSDEKTRSLYNYYDIEIKGRSFLYKQVRRIVAVLVAVAQNRISLKDVYEMITIPSANSWCSQSSVVPPYGLYLCKVDYNQEDLIKKLE